MGKGEQAVKIDVKNQKPLLEYFSRGQFEDLSDDEKISTTDFDLMSAGIQLGAEQAYDSSKEMESTGTGFEDIILKEEGSIKQEQPGFYWQGERSLNVSGSRRIINQNRPEEVFGIVDELPGYVEKGYKIVSKESLETPGALIESYFITYSAARDYLQNNWKEDKKLWQIMEVEAEESEAIII